MNFENAYFVACVVAVLSGVGAILLMLHWTRKKAGYLSDQLSRCQVRNSNLDEECRRLAWATADQIKSLKRDLESRAINFQKQHQSTPHIDHSQRAIGYQEAAATMEQMIREMEKRGGGEQKIKVDLG